MGNFLSFTEERKRSLVNDNEKYLEISSISLFNDNYIERICENLSDFSSEIKEPFILRNLVDEFSKFQYIASFFGKKYSILNKEVRCYSILLEVHLA